MVRLLIDLRATIGRHRLARSSHALLVLSALLALASAAGTFALGFVHFSDPDAAGDVLAIVFLLWIGGLVAQSSLSGEATLRPEMFALLPIPKRRLARGLLVVGVLDPVQVLPLLAFAALIPAAAGDTGGGSIEAIVVAVVSTALTALLAAVLSTVAKGLLGPGSRRRGRDLGTVLTAVALSALALVGSALPALTSALRHGRIGWLTAIVRALPSGWAVDALGAARRSQPLLIVLPLVGLMALTLVVAALWPGVLARRMVPSGGVDRRRGAQSSQRRLARSALGGVWAKELILWRRDPTRLTCLIIALLVGVGACLIPRATTGTTLLEPFAGALSVIIAGACACNLYGLDGPSLTLTVLAPSSARADVRGRQAAWLTIVGPYAVIATVALTAISGRSAAWPWALALVVSLLGGAAGLIPSASLVSVQPLDESGNPTPQFSAKVHVALLAIALTAVPSLALLIIGSVMRDETLQWAALVVGVITGGLLAWGLGAAATRRLNRIEVDVLRTLIRG